MPNNAYITGGVFHPLHTLNNQFGPFVIADLLDADGTSSTWKMANYFEDPKIPSVQYRFIHPSIGPGPWGFLGQQKTNLPN